MANRCAFCGGTTKPIGKDEGGNTRLECQEEVCGKISFKPPAIPQVVWQRFLRLKSKQPGIA